MELHIQHAIHNLLDKQKHVICIYLKTTSLSNVHLQDTAMCNGYVSIIFKLLHCIFIQHDILFSIPPILGKDLPPNAP